MNLSIMHDGSEQIHYQKSAIPIYICCGDLIHFSNMTALCHWHEDVELLMPTVGYLNYNINGTIIRVEQGDAIFINSRQMHYGFSADGSDCQYICICFKPDLLNVHPYLYDNFVRPIIQNTGLPYLQLHKKNTDHSRILTLIQEMAQMQERNMILIAKLCELWQGVYESANVTMIAPADRNVDILKEMLAYISTHYSERMNMAELAPAAGVCRSRCCQIFQKYMGTTPNVFITSYRLERAMELLRETNLSVTEIASACGFNSSSYFTESFVKYKGCTPTEYRKKYR